MRGVNIKSQASATHSLTACYRSQPERSQPERSRRVTVTWSIPLLFLLLVACYDGQKQTKLYNFDALIDDQIGQLSQRTRVLDKGSELDGQQSDSTFVPTPKEWSDELEVFRQLELINKPANRNGYQVDDPLKDVRSNLRIRKYQSITSPVPFVKFYYQDKFSQLRKIEALIMEKNILYTTHRTLTMEFEEEDNKPILSRYSLSGFQKVPFTDTVRFSVTAEIEW